MSVPYLVRPGQNRPGWRAWLAPAYNVLVVAVIVVIGVSLLVTGNLGQRLGGVVLVVMGAWWARQTVVAIRGLLTRRDTTVPVRVRLDDHGVTVYNGSDHDCATTDGGAGRPAFLAWDDCVAVVASRAPARADGRPLFYVHFMPRTDSAVRLEDVPAEYLELKSRLCGIPLTTGAALAWLLVPVDVPVVPRVLAQVRARAPHVRVVDSMSRAHA